MLEIVEGEAFGGLDAPGLEVCLNGHMSRAGSWSAWVLAAG